MEKGWNQRAETASMKKKRHIQNWLEGAKIEEKRLGSEKEK